MTFKQPSKGACLVASDEAMQTLCFTSMSSDHHGRSEKGVGRARNFAGIRERTHVVPVCGGDRPSAGAGVTRDPIDPAMSSSFGLTQSGTAHTIKPAADFEMNKSLADSFRPKPQKGAPALEPGVTSYMTHFAKRQPFSGTALPGPLDNSMSGIVGPGSGSKDSYQTFASTQYREPPKELRMPGQPYAGPSIPFWTAGQTQADFFESHYGIEFSKAGGSKALRKRAPLSASAPQLSGDASSDPRAALRKALMKTHYSRTTGRVVKFEGHDVPNAAKVRKALGM